MLLNRVLSRICVICFALSAPVFLHSQDASVIINIPSPTTPFLSEWKGNPAVGSVIVINHTGKDLPVQYHLLITHENRGTVFEGMTIEETLPSTGSMINNQNIADFTWIDDKWDNDLEKTIFRTGRLLEGAYVIAVSILVENQVIARESHTMDIQFPDPPQLLIPENESTVNTPQQVFLWTPALLPPGWEIVYQIKIANLLSRQTPLRALRANVPLLQTTLNGTNFPYSIDGLPFQDGESYAWQVRAVDETGAPLANNDGYSEIFVFRFQDNQSQFQPQMSADTEINFSRIGMSGYRGYEQETNETTVKFSRIGMSGYRGYEQETNETTIRFSRIGMSGYRGYEQETNETTINFSRIKMQGYRKK